MDAEITEGAGVEGQMVTDGFQDLLQAPQETTPAAGDGQDTGAQPDESQAEPAPAQEKPPVNDEEGTPTGLQKRLDKLTWEKHEARREAERLKAELEALKVSPPKPTAPAEGEPQEDKFEDYSQYVRALAKWEAKQEMTAREAAARQAERTRNQEQSRESLSAKLQEGYAKHKDFSVAFKSPQEGGPAVSETMVEALTRSEIPADVLYHLAQNREDSFRIATLQDPIAVSREITLIEAKLKATPPAEPRASSKATPPIKPVSAGATTSTVDLEKMSMDDFIAHHARKSAATRNRTRAG